MARNGLYSGIDIGTNTIKVVVAECVSGQVNVIGNGNAESVGLKNGIIVDIEKTAMSIRKAVVAAQEKSGVVVDKVNVAIPANQLAIEPCQGMIQIAGTNKEIMDNDVVEVVSNALMRGLVPEREIIAVEPKEFIVDGFSEISDPRGMLGVRLEMKGILYTGPKTLIHNILTSVERAGVSIGNITIAPLVAASQILNEQEREFGAVCIDMGAGQTTVSGMKDNELKFVITRPEGGDYITKDISTVLNTSLAQAEAIKQNYGEADIERASQEEYFLVDTVGQSDPAQVSEYYLSGIVSARLTQIFEKIHQDMERNHALDYPGGVVLYGGAAALPGVVRLAQRVFQTNVHIHVPSELGLRNPAYSQVLSNIKYISERSDIEVLITQAVIGDIPSSANYDTGTSYATAVPSGQSDGASIPAEPSPPALASENNYAISGNQQSEASKEDKPGVIDRVRGLFTNMFD